MRIQSRADVSIFVPPASKNSDLKRYFDQWMLVERLYFLCIGLPRLVYATLRHGDMEVPRLGPCSLKNCHPNGATVSRLDELSDVLWSGCEK